MRGKVGGRGKKGETRGKGQEERNKRRKRKEEGGRRWGKGERRKNTKADKRRRGEEKEEIFLLGRSGFGGTCKLFGTHLLCYSCPIIGSR